MGGEMIDQYATTLDEVLALRSAYSQMNTAFIQANDEIASIREQLALERDLRTAADETVKMLMGRARPDLVKVLEDARDSFEFIRLHLIGDLEEPQRSAFWRAVNSRDSCVAALADQPKD